MDKPASIGSSLFIILVGGALLFVGLYFEGYRLQQRDHATPLEGTVVGVSAAHGNRTAGQSVATVRFIGPGGRPSSYSYQTETDATHIGDKVALLHDVETGATVLDSFFGLYGPLLWTLPGGAALVLLGGTLLFGAARRRR
ncbi:MAG: hypothetical protein M3Z29_14485 [Pseudomonadota bacterium]|nr:hypothetical protein [Pseudomonadota bacterium]